MLGRGSRHSLLCVPLACAATVRDTIGQQANSRRGTLLSVLSKSLAHPSTVCSQSQCLRHLCRRLCRGSHSSLRQAKAAPAVSNSTTDIACFQKALTIREDEIIKAWTERETAIGKAMETRKKALIAAFTKQTNVDRAKALVAAHTKFNTKRLIINKNLTTKVDNSWNKFLKD